MSSDKGKVYEALRFARAYAAEKLPWFAPALFRCQIVVTELVTVAAVDAHYNIYWNPDVVQELYRQPDRMRALSELGFLWVHEISHLLRDHAKRGERWVTDGNSSPRSWNVACDLEINDAQWPGLRMPAAYPGRLPEHFGLENGQFAEWYFPRIRPSDPEIADEGSGVHGQARPWEVGGRQRLSPLDVALLQREVARRTREADPNQVPAPWRAWAKNVLGSRVDWRRRLQHRLRMAVQQGVGARIDYRYGSSNRRQSVLHPFLPPTLTGGLTTRLAVVVDTSGSMQDQDLQRTLAEVAAIVRQLGGPVTVIPCDARAYDPVTMLTEHDAFRTSRLPGGGGTDLRAGLRAAEVLRPTPDAILVLTDGETAYPEHAPSIPTLIGLLPVDGVFADPPVPPFAPQAVVRIQ